MLRLLTRAAPDPEPEPDAKPPEQRGRSLEEVCGYGNARSGAERARALPTVVVVGGYRSAAADEVLDAGMGMVPSAYTDVLAPRGGGGGAPPRSAVGDHPGDAFLGFGAACVRGTAYTAGGFAQGSCWT